MEEELQVLNPGLRLLCQAEHIVEAELSFKVQCQADEGVDEVDETLHGLASCDKSANHPDFRLAEEVFEDFFHRHFDLNLMGSLISGVDAAQTDQLLLE